MQPQKAVQRLCVVDSGGLRHAAACLAGRRAELDDVVRVEQLVDFDDCLQDRALAGAGAARDDGQIVLEDGHNALVLPLGKRDAEAGLDALHCGDQIHRLRLLQQHLDGFHRGLALLREHEREIDIALVGYNDVRQDHRLQLIVDLYGADQLFGSERLLIEQLQRIFDQRLRLQIQVASFASGPLQRVEKRALHSHRVQQIAAGFLHDGVHTLEAEAGDLAQTIGAFSQQRDTCRPKVVVDPHGRRRRDLERRENRHQIPQRLALGVSGLDLLQTIRRDASNLQKAFRLVLDHIQRGKAETPNDGVRRSLPDVLDEAGGEITVNALQRSRNDLLPALDLELKAVLAVDPFSLHFHLDRVGLRKVIAHRDKTDQMVGETVRAPGVLRHHDVCRLHTEYAILACLIVEQLLIKGRYNPHCFHLRRLRLMPHLPCSA